MKKLLYVLSLVFLTVFTLTGCGVDNVQEHDTQTESEDQIKDYVYNIDDTRFNIIKADGTSDYVIVRKENTSNAVIDACKRLRDAIFDATGVKLEITTDFVKAGHPEFQEKEFEILVGNTNRDVSEFAFSLTSKAKDIAVLQSGTKLAILSNHSSNISDAVEYFIQNYIDSQNCTVSTEIGESIVVSDEYPVETFLLNGVDMGEYTICYGSGRYKPYAEKIAAFVYDNYGKTLELKQNAAYDDIHISLDTNPDKPDSHPTVDSLESVVHISENGITLASGAFCDHEGFVENFVDTYFSEASIAKNIDMTISETSEKTGSDFIRVDDKKLIDGIDRKSEQRKQSILNTPNLFTEDKMPLEPGNRIIYVSNDGSDVNTGLTPETAICSLSKLKSIGLSKGDRVLFRRGDEFRGRIETVAGVVYSSYGKGPKPIINANLKDAAQKHLWVETDTPNVYKCTLKYSNVGNIVFNYSGIVGNHDELHGNLRVIGLDGVSSYIDLYKDLDFVSDLETDYLYLCSTEGNPGERFDSIEICENVHAFSNSAPDVIIDNLNIVFAGGHGVSMGDVQNRTVQNCIFSWIGGSILKGFNGGNYVRYGNAVEVYGQCDGYYVYDNWMYQIYDTGVTHQYSSNDRTIQMKNIEYRGNIIEKCHWSIEYYNRGAMPGSCVHNVHVHDNIVLRGGYGWGSVGRESGSGMHNGFDMVDDVKNYVVENNIFAYSKGNLVRYHEGGDRKLTLRNNTYLQFYGRTLGYMFGSTEKYDGSVVRNLVDVMGEENPVVIYIMDDYEKQAEIEKRLAEKE